MADALAQTGRASDVGSVSVGGQQHGLVVLDSSGRPLRKAPLWNDTRSAPNARALVDSLGGPEACAKRVGSVLTSSFTVAHWAWLRRTEPEVAAAARRAMLPHDYLNFCLTGVATTDRSDASGTGWWSPADNTYVAEVLALGAVQLEPELLPEVLPPEGMAGEVTGEAAQQFGLLAGTTVACGAGDNAAAALALSFVPGEAALSLGTSGTVTRRPPCPAPTPRAPSPDLPVPTGVFCPWRARSMRPWPLTVLASGSSCPVRTWPRPTELSSFRGWAESGLPMLPRRRDNDRGALPDR